MINIWLFNDHAVMCNNLVGVTTSRTQTGMMKFGMKHEHLECGFVAVGLFILTVSITILTKAAVSHRILWSVK